MSSAVVSASPTARVFTKPKKARPFYGRHPWVLESAIDRVEGEPADGDCVELCNEQSKFIALGTYNSRSRIRVRLLNWEVGGSLDEAFYRGKLQTAFAARKAVGLHDLTGAARLVFSEADGLSGLVVDRFCNYLSVQVNAQGMAVRLPMLVSLLNELCEPRGIFIRTEKGVPQSEGIDLRDGLYAGESPEGPVFIEENGLRFGVDLAEGQKTGFYLDQRDNRRVAAEYLRGRNVLDLFCYSGGFAINAAKHGAATVLAVDSSAKALELAKANAELNELRTIHFEQSDAFQFLDGQVAAGKKYGGIVLDPPKFARSRTNVEEALRAYHRLNRLAVDLLEPGGVLVTNSCSGHVTRDDFTFMLVGVAQQTKRDIQILEQRGPAPDHPVAVTCLQTDYLKCFICRVM